jgi:ubiquinone/menaquinone biosynthesis C-methylase UbiE
MDNRAKRAEFPDVHSAQPDYAARFEGRAGAYLLETQERGLRSLLASTPPPATVLDVGGGHGQVTPLLLQLGYTVTTLASSKEYGFSCLNQRETRRSYERIVSPLLPLSLEAQSFDIVVCIRQVSHLSEWPAFLTELARVARKKVLIDYASWQSFNLLSRFFFTIKKSVEKSTRPYLIQSDSDILTHFEAASFEKESHYRECFLPLALHRAMKGHSSLRHLETMCRRTKVTSFFGNPVLLSVTRIPFRSSDDSSMI